GGGRVTVEGTEEERATLTDLGVALGTPTVVRVIETLGQAIVDMRGVDAADPRLVLEVALVKLSRREAGPPVVMLEQRVARLEAASAGSPPLPAAAAAPTAAAAPAAPSPPPAAAPAATPAAAPKRAVGGVRSERAARTVETPSDPDPEPDPAPVASPERPESSTNGPLDLD